MIPDGSRDEMTEQVVEHYENLLAQHYDWMLGNFDEKVKEAEETFRKLNLPEGSDVLDLGCGSGIHSIALARLDMRVTSVDLSPSMLRELEKKKGDLSIELVEADLLEFAGNPDQNKKYDLIVCMGDTLCHLPTTPDVYTLFENMRDHLLKTRRGPSSHSAT